MGYVRADIAITDALIYLDCLETAQIPIRARSLAADVIPLIDDAVDACKGEAPVEAQYWAQRISEAMHIVGGREQKLKVFQDSYRNMLTEGKIVDQKAYQLVKHTLENLVG